MQKNNLEDRPALENISAKSPQIYDTRKSG